jgi:hypothetical protein
MKKLFYFTIALLGLNASAQVGIGVPTANIDASAQLEVASTSKGFLAPRMTEAQKNAITSPASGLLVFQTDGTSGFYYYNASAWSPIAPSGSSGSSAFPVLSSTQRDALGITTQGNIIFNTTTNTYQGSKFIQSPYDNLTDIHHGQSICSGSDYIEQGFTVSDQMISAETTISSITLSVYQVTTPGTFHIEIIDNVYNFSIAEGDFQVNSSDENKTVNIPILFMGFYPTPFYSPSNSFKITCKDGGEVKFLVNGNVKAGVGSYYNSTYNRLYGQLADTTRCISAKINLTTEGVVEWVNLTSL